MGNKQSLPVNEAIYHAAKTGKSRELEVDQQCHLAYLTKQRSCVSLLGVLEKRPARNVSGEFAGVAR